MESKKSPQLLIVDLGSQYTQVIARELLGLGYKAIILAPVHVTEYLRQHAVKGIILSGGAASVYDENAPVIPEEIFTTGCPVLGICYGMQYIAYRSDKALVQGVDNNAKEYGPTEITLSESVLFAGLSSTLSVWASHGDIVKAVPQGFKIIAQAGTVIEGIENTQAKIYAVQFHPEVTETLDNNMILQNFATTICGCQKDWQSTDVISLIQAEVAGLVGNGRAAIGVSGGVDSTTLAALLSPVLKDKLYAFFIDTGGMRHNEVDEVRMLCKNAGVNLHVVDAKKEFFASLDGVTDAEKKGKNLRMRMRRSLRAS